MILTHGWSDSLQIDFAPFAARGLIPGRVTVQQRDLWTLATDLGELRGRLAGRLARGAGAGEHPVVGDWAAIAPSPVDGPAVIHALLPRRTVFVRRTPSTPQGVQVVAANVDVALLTAPMTTELNLRRLERYLAAAWQSGARPVIVLTKADLSRDPRDSVARAESIAFGATVLAVSIVTGEGLAPLAAQTAPGQTAALLGASGAGKSSLVNALTGEALMTVGEIREDDGRGRHTTTHRELIRLPGGALILDTPGMRELGLMDADEGLDVAFEDIDALAEACRFADCAHDREPGCAVRAALASGALDEGRWLSYRKLRRELAHLERKEDRLAREVERRRWAAIGKANRARRKTRDRW